MSKYDKPDEYNSLLTLLNYLLMISVDIVNADSGLLLLGSEGCEEFKVSIIKNVFEDSVSKDRVKLEIQVGKWLFDKKKNESVLLKDTNNMPWHFSYLKESRQVKSIIYVTLKLESPILKALVLTRSPGKDNFDLDDLELANLLGDQIGVIITNTRLKEFSERSCSETIAVLAAMIEAKDPVTIEHSERVKKYAVLIARQMKFPEDKMELLRRAAMLHDIGKIGIDENILKKPGPLTYTERLQVQKHPFIGVHILKPLKILKEILPAIYHHHEYYDGQGYLDKLKGEEILLESRILAMADALDAMSSTRPYRVALSEEKIIEEIEKEKGKQFDPGLVECVMALIEKNRLKFPAVAATGVNEYKGQDRKVILIVDDNKDFSLLLKKNLEDFDSFCVVTASGGQEGLRMAGAVKPDLIILDIMMPVMNGFVTLEILKKNDNTRDIPVIVLTVKNDEASKKRAFCLYADDYMTKPVETDEIKERIKTILEKKKNQLDFNSIN